MLVRTLRWKPRSRRRGDTSDSNRSTKIELKDHKGASHAGRIPPVPATHPDGGNEAGSRGAAGRRVGIGLDRLPEKSAERPGGNSMSTTIRRGVCPVATARGSAHIKCIVRNALAAARHCASPAASTLLARHRVTPIGVRDVSPFTCSRSRCDSDIRTHSPAGKSPTFFPQHL